MSVASNQTLRLIGSQRTVTWLGFAVWLSLAIALLFGGASRQNQIQYAIVLGVCGVLAPLIAWRWEARSRLRLPLLVIGMIAVIPIVTLVPLPPELWTKIPGRALARSVFAAVGMSVPWEPISLTPQLTVRSALSLVPPILVFLATATMSNVERRGAAYVVLALVVIGLILGSVQVTGAVHGWWGTAVSANEGHLLGFFANRNHQAALLVAALPLATAGMLRAVKVADKPAIVTIIAASVILLLIAAVATVRSRAGILLLPVSLVGCGLLVWRSGLLRLGKRVALGLVIGIAGAIILVSLFALPPLLARFSASMGEDLRFAVAPDIWKAALRFLPFGSGMGSFDSVYRTVERPEFISPFFLNHAHNDYLELWLEVGLLGVFPLLAFSIWLLTRVRDVWSGEGSGYDFARAGMIVIALLTAHSAVDYPLRTLALSCVFGFACGLLILPEAATRQSRGRGARAGQASAA